MDGDIPEIRFVRPVPGFAELTRFALVRLEGDDDVPGIEPALFELRSLEQPDIAFVVARPNAFFSDYEFELDTPSAGDLGLDSATDALVLVVLTVGADAASTTANLLAPVVVNVRTRSAAQVILSGTDWPVRAAIA